MADEDLRNRYRRDFTREPIAGPPAVPAAQKASSVPAPEPAQKPNEAIIEALPDIPAISSAARQTKTIRRKNWKKLFIVLVVFFVIAGLAVGGYYFWSVKFAIPIPAATRSSVDFPLLYPTKLPNGFSLKKNSFSTTKDVVVYEAVSSSASIAFSVQQRPPNFDFATFYKQSLTNSSTFTTLVGEAAVGNANGRLLGSLTTDQSWLLVSSDSNKVTSSDIRLILQNVKLAPANNH